MQISNFVLFGAIELFLVLICLSIYLLLHARSLKKLIKRLQEKLEEVITDVKHSRKEAKQARAQLTNNTPANAAREFIADQLEITRDHHDSLEAGQNIALDLALDNPLPRRTAALRHAFLIAEKEALHSSKDGKPNWTTLETKLDQLIQFFNFKPNGENAKETEAPAGDPEALVQLQQELEANQKRIENLEKFKKLFFDMEDQWRAAKKQAEDYHAQLSSMAGEVSDQGAFEGILENYNQVYNSIGQTIEVAAQEAGGGAPDRKPSTGDTIIVEGSSKRNISTIEITKTDPQTLKELKQLRSVASDQHKIIAELQRKLSSSSSAEEKANMVADLSEQLKRQTLFLKESETCLQLLEDELGRAMQEASDLREQLESSDSELEKLPKLQALVQQFSSESKDMLDKISDLERENEQLLAQGSFSDSGESGESAQFTSALADGTAELQQQLLDAQSQYAELEERYLDLKMQSL